METVGVALRSVIKLFVLLFAGGLAAQHSMLPLGSDLSSLLIVASIGALLVRRARPVAIVILGFAIFHMAGLEVIERRLEPRFSGDSMLAIIRVTDFPRIDGDSLSMTVEPLADPRLPPRSRVSWFEPPVVPAIGEVWELELRLRRPRGNANPGVFDVETWLFRERIHATGYVVNGQRNRLLWSGTASPLEAFRARFAWRARAATESRDAAAVLTAIGTGARHDVTRAQWDRFAISGTSHLMAISGLHVGLAGMVGLGLAWGLAGLLPLQSGQLRAALLGGLAVAAGYAWVSGFGVPAQRATLMLAVATLAVLRRRQPQAGEAVAVSGAAVFLANPVASMTPGFSLSFGAVVLLLWLARRRAIDPPRRWHAPLRLWVLQVFLMFGLLPLTALLFQRFAIVATPVNLVAVPVFSIVVVPLTLAGMALGEVSEPVAAPLLQLAAVVIDALDAVIRWSVGLPFADLRLANFEGVASMLLVLPLAWVLLPKGWPGRGLACIGIVAIVLWRPAPPPADCFDAWTLDVGQGLAVVIETRRDVLLYDTGMAWRSGSSAAEQVIEPFLTARGIRRLDGLFVSHDDLDHSGGAPFITQAMQPRFILSGEPLRDVGSRLCEAGAVWWSGAVRFTVLHPASPWRREGNDASCVLRVSVGSDSLLLTGDIEASAERRLLQHEAAVGAEVALVPHHGSETSSSVPFVDSVSPLLAIVSAGHANRWGFPRESVVRRWRAVGATVLSTARHGAVRVRLCAGRGIVEARLERERRRRFWHAE
jgi:competence protein ComEC